MSDEVRLKAMPSPEAATGEGAMDGLPDIYLVVVDSLRGDRFGRCSDDGVGLLPRTYDLLKNDSIELTNCFSTSTNTPPAMCSLLTSSYPLEYDGYAHLWERPITLAEVLGRHGYRTAAFHSNPYLSTGAGFERGFDVYVDDRAAEGKVAESVRPLSCLLPRRIQRFAHTLPYMDGQTLNKKVRTWIASTSSPRFAWIHYMDVHGPYVPEKNGRKRWRDRMRAEFLWQKAVRRPASISGKERDLLRRTYEAETKYVDDRIAELLTWIDSSSSRGNSVVILVADHGESFGEHGLFSHGGLPFDELMHIPAMLRLPGREGGAWDGLCSLLDMVPTLLGYLGFSDDAQRAYIRGRNILDDLQEGPQDDEILFNERVVRSHGGLRFGVRTRQWKLLIDEEEHEETLYDLLADPGERDDVSRSHEQVLRELKERLRTHLADIGATGRGAFVKREISEELKERFRALGYFE